MIDILCLILVTSIWILGLTIATQEGMIFNSFRKWADKKESLIFEAVILCPWCMPSIHSMFGYGFVFATGVVDFHWKILIAYPLVVCGASMVSGMIWLCYQKIEKQLAHLDNIEQLSHWDVIERKDQHHQSRKQHRGNHSKTINHER